MSEQLAEKVGEATLEQKRDSNDMDKAVRQLLEELAEEKKIKMFSELTQQEIKHLSVLNTAGDQLIQDFTKEFLLMKVSHGREGRRELIEVGEAISAIRQAGNEGGITEKLKNALSR